MKKKNILDKKFREILFEVIVANNIYDPYWEKFNARKPQLQNVWDISKLIL